MSKAEREHNQGQKDVASGTGLDNWIQQNNPLTSSDYKKGHRHGYDHRPKHSKDSDYSGSDSNSSSSSSSSDSCYVTTACVEAMGLSDNCFELQTLRNYRDTYLKNQPTGISDIKLYYKVAPLIVKRIHELPNSREFLINTFRTLVSPCVNLIVSGKLDEARKHYKRSIQYLIEKLEIANKI